MIDKRWPWYVAGGLFVLAGIAAGVATYLWWLPCRGQMMYGVHIWPTPESAEFTDACLRRMDEGTVFPGQGHGLSGVPGLLLSTVAAVALTGLACLVPVLTLPFRRPVRLVLLLPGLLVLTTAVVLAQTAEVGRGGVLWDTESLEISSGLLDALLLALLVAIPVAVTARQSLDAVLWIFAGSALAAFTFVGAVADYVLMGLWSGANWDAPPGSGYLIAGWLMICGAVIIVVTTKVGDAAPVSSSRDLTHNEFGAATSSASVEGSTTR